MPETLTAYGLRQALEIFCQSLPAIQFHYYGADTRFDGKLETLLYRSAHELIHNAVKHARATHINVQLVQESARIALTVHDDGCGFDPSQTTDGTGLRNIRHRVAAFNGEFNTVSAPGAGMEISMEFQL
jgi:signal transduction histidine kinase